MAYARFCAPAYHVGVALFLIGLAASLPEARAQAVREAAPTPTDSALAAVVDRQADRGPGVPTSMFGTYVRRGELLIYPFFEYYRANRYEYKPSDFGATGDLDHHGKLRTSELLLFGSYGITDNVAVEWEAAGVRASLAKAPDDPSLLAARTTEAGLGDVEGQIRWRWKRETDHRPELFSYAEMVIPHHHDRPLTGTGGVELKFGTGMIRGFAHGTLTVRGAVEYAADSTSHFDYGEYAVEYLKRLGPHWRVFVAVEGKQDEASAIVEAQLHLTPNVFLRLNSGQGLTKKSTNWAPEVGVVFSLGRH